MPKDRGLKEAQDYFDLIPLIENQLKKKKKIKILDAGCGYGIAMMDIVKKFGDRVEVHGFLDNSRWGNPNIMKKESIKRGIFTKSEIKKIKLPKYHYCDASVKLPFKSNTFDVIYSMAMVYLVDDKVNFFEEANRILSPNGIARISSPFGRETRGRRNYLKNKGMPNHYLEFYEIWDKGKEIEFHKYINKFKGIRVVVRGSGLKERNYVEIKKQPKIDLKLRFITSIDYNFIWKDWGGVKSIYTTQFKFNPRYKKSDKSYYRK